MESKKKFSVLKLIRNILIIILILYVLTIIYKASIMSYISFKIGGIKESNNYEYWYKTFFNQAIHEKDKMIYEKNYSNCTVSFKDGISLETTSSDAISISASLYYTNPENKATYSDTYTVTDTGDENHTYSYQEGFSYESNSPYELVNNNLQRFYKASFLLNPFKIIKIDFNYHDFIFEDNDGFNDNGNELYEKNLIYINTYNCLLNKEEHYQNDKLIYTYLYSNYEFDAIQRSLELTEEEKQFIINNSPKDENT